MQPGTDEQLQCLECGRWYRHLGQHVVAIHDISADAYRERHELPAGQGLHAPATTRRRAERGRRQWAEDPEMRAKFRPKSDRAQLSELSRQARRATRTRAGVRRSGAANGQRAHAAWLASIDAEFEVRAREHGYLNLSAMLTATSHLSGPALGTQLGVSAKRIWNLRARHDIANPLRWPTPDSSGLDTTPPGTQPRDLQGRQRCLECGGWYKALHAHLYDAHRLRVRDYKNRHQLAGVRITPTTPRDDLKSRRPHRRSRHETEAGPVRSQSTTS